MEGGGGCVVNVSSQASVKPLVNHTAYSASKAALDAITRQMALDLAPKVNNHAPFLLIRNPHLYYSRITL